jgi:hypothetical protein
MAKSQYQFGREPKPGERVVIDLKELVALIDKADAALDGDSNDAEHDALYSIRETLAELSTDPNARRD